MKTLIILSIRNGPICVNYLLRHYKVLRRYCLNGKYCKHRGDLLKRAVWSVFILYATSRETFYTPYLAHLTLPEKNSVKTDQTVPLGVVWSVIFYYLRQDKLFSKVMLWWQIVITHIRLSFWSRLIWIIFLPLSSLTLISVSDSECNRWQFSWGYSAN